MREFEYVRPASVAEAIDAARAPEAAYLAGGTNIVELMKLGVVQPARLVDIGGLRELERIEHLDDGSVRIGALVRNAALASDRRFAESFPMIAEAILSGASGQLRNAATVGGNLLQRTRCAYFYDLAARCNKRDPNTGCDALGGQNHGHAVLGWTESCIATHPSDFCVPVLALDALVDVDGPRGRRSVRLEDFYLPPVQPERETVLEPGELVVGLHLPASARSFARAARYLKLRERTSFAFAVVSAAAGLVIENGRIADARIALGGVASRPWRSRRAEQSLTGAEASDGAFRAAADEALADASPSGHNAHKIELARRLVVRALTAAAAGTGDRPPALPGSVFSTTPGDTHDE